MDCSLRLILEFKCATHIILRLVTMREPLSPLFPLVSSTELMESMSSSPLRHIKLDGCESNLMSRSCQMYSGADPDDIVTVLCGKKCGMLGMEPANIYSLNHSLTHSLAHSGINTCFRSMLRCCDGCCARYSADTMLGEIVLCYYAS